MAAGAAGSAGGPYAFTWTLAARLRAVLADGHAHHLAHPPRSRHPGSAQRVRMPSSHAGPATGFDHWW
ncbi:hypothetical protein [Kitasatospora sp. NPDC093102]|uniref:hypothetical protein n=1 Tax=Kitasatospora sp. NPDC093102 TaxID=3155069 RepID=UPI0034164B73